jgi:ATP-dependent RNA helicase DeaD
MSQQQRDRVMQAFRSGQTEVLVATDVAARGLDIPSVSHVINYDLPSSAEVYVHRIGRTGRAGREGAAITIIDPREHRLLRSIEQLTKAKVVVAPVPTVSDLRAKRAERTLSSIREVLVAGELGHFRTVVTTLAQDYEVVDVAAAAIKLAHQRQGGERDETEIPAVPTFPQPSPYRRGQHPVGRPDDRYRGGAVRPGDRRTAGRQVRSGGEPGMARVYVGAGRESGIRPGDLVGAIANEAKISSGVIGAIEIEERFSIVDVPVEMAKGIVEALGRSHIKGRRVPVRLFRE